MSQVTNADLYNRMATELVDETDGRWTIRDDARETVTQRLIEVARTHHVIVLARGYFEVAYALDEAGVKGAAEAIVSGINDARPHLPKLVLASFENLQDQSRSLVGGTAEKAAPKYGAPEPEGSLKLSSFLDPGRTPRPGAPRR